MPAPGGYVFDDAWHAERARLGALERALDPGTFDLLGRIGVTAGWRCAEVGAGSGSVAAWLSERVGATGGVLAVDIQTGLLERLRAANLTVRCHDIVADPLPESSFDLVHVRWMLHWPPDRQRAIGHLVSALRPGGRLLAEEPDFVTMCEAGSSSCFRAVVSAAVDVHEKAGGGMNSRYGRDLMRDLSGYGLVDTGGEGRVHMLRGGDDSTGAAWLRLTIEKARDRVLESAAVTPAQFDETIRLLDDPDFLTMFPLTFAVWGRRA